jgi:CDP-6-deoxy-D-xylo-4-hexulose-3-dehydrase
MKRRDVRLAGVIQGQEEIDAVIRVMKTDPPWHVSGQECALLQKELAEYIGVEYGVVVNSGSSANLLALASLNLPKGSRILTSACGFPATLNPIIHLGYTPVLVDYNINTLQIDLEQVEEALRLYKPAAMIVAHTLGSCCNVEKLVELSEKYSCVLIEDACEAIGSEFNGKKLGSFGKIGTVSFYSSHQISGFGGGGALLTNDKEIYERAKSLRDWGKESVREGYICTVLDTVVDDIPYDKQYTYATIGYNMRYPDANCAYAREQLKRLPNFCKVRQENYCHLEQSLIFKKDLSDKLIFMGVESSNAANELAFFGFPVVLNKEGLRDKLVAFLEKEGIHVRLFFAGNILRHKAYEDIGYIYLAKENPFPVADYLMKNAFFVGCWPGLTLEDMNYIAEKIKQFFDKEI